MLSYYLFNDVRLYKNIELTCFSCRPKVTYSQAEYANDDSTNYGIYVA